MAGGEVNCLNETDSNFLPFDQNAQLANQNIKSENICYDLMEGSHLLDDSASKYGTQKCP